MIGAFLCYRRYLQHAISYIKRRKLNNKYRYLIFIGWWLLAKVFRGDLHRRQHILFGLLHMAASYKRGWTLRRSLAPRLRLCLHIGADG